MKKKYLVIIIVIAVCILGLLLINKRNKEVHESNESGSFSHEESFYEYEEPAETGDEKKAGSLGHWEYYYDEGEEIPEDDDGLTPITSHTYWADEEE